MSEQASSTAKYHQEIAAVAMLPGFARLMRRIRTEAEDVASRLTQDKNQEETWKLRGAYHALVDIERLLQNQARSSLDLIQGGTGNGAFPDGIPES